MKTEGQIFPCRCALSSEVIVERICLDTSALYEWFRGDDDKVAAMMPHLADKRIVVSWMQLAELTSVLERRAIDSKPVIDAVRANFHLVAPVESDFISGGIIQADARKTGNQKFSLFDGIIAAFSKRERIACLSFDADLADKDNIIFLQ